MLSEVERDALEDIREAISRATEFVAGTDLEQFLTDLKTFYAATRCLEIISEASRRLPTSFKERHPEIPWKDVAGAVTCTGTIMKASWKGEFGPRFTTLYRRCSRSPKPN